MKDLINIVKIPDQLYQRSNPNLGAILLQSRYAATSAIVTCVLPYFSYTIESVEWVVFRGDQNEIHHASHLAAIALYIRIFDFEICEMNEIQIQPNLCQIWHLRCNSLPVTLTTRRRSIQLSRSQSFHFGHRSDDNQYALRIENWARLVLVQIGTDLVIRVHRRIRDLIKTMKTKQLRWWKEFQNEQY